MPHRPEDTEFVHRAGDEFTRPGETRSEGVEPSHEGPRPTADTQTPAPQGRKAPGRLPSHGGRR